MTIEQLAALILEQTQARLKADYPTSPQWEWERVQVKPGPKYTKIDRGPEHNMSGFLMIDNATGEIFGIKGYSRVHKGRRYGTLDTAGQWYWGNYSPDEDPEGNFATYTEARLIASQHPGSDVQHLAGIIRERKRLERAVQAKEAEMASAPKRYSDGDVRELLTEQGYEPHEQDRAFALIGRWHARGDGAAIYENQDLGHPELGHIQIVSYGGPDSQLETPTPPERLPDIGGHINWRYTLTGVLPPPAQEEPAKPAGPVDPELFRRTAPQWNCVDYPGEGMHYTPKAGEGCAWCGATPEQIRAEHDARDHCWNDFCVLGPHEGDRHQDTTGHGWAQPRGTVYCPAHRGGAYHEPGDCPEGYDSPVVTIYEHGKIGEAQIRQALGTIDYDEALRLTREIKATAEGAVSTDALAEAARGADATAAALATPQEDSTPKPFEPRHPLDRSAAHHALLGLSAEFGQSDLDQAGQMITDMLTGFYASGGTDMYAYAKGWVTEREGAAKPVADDPVNSGPCPHWNEHGDRITCTQAEETDSTVHPPNTPEFRVWVKAQENGRAAASWIFDGNTTRETYARFADGIEEGDPEVMDSVRTPSLAGEYGDDYSEDDLMADTGWVPHDGTDLRDALAEQYNTDVSAAFWGEVERQAVKGSNPGLDDAMEFDHVIKISPAGRITDAEGVYAPELAIDTDDDGQILAGHEAAFIEDARRQGWELLTGYSGQDRYSGPVMHASEFVGGALADHILRTPGLYVVTSVETLDDSEQPAGWVVAYREDVTS